jgi:hypothetical protein
MFVRHDAEGVNFGGTIGTVGVNGLQDPSITPFHDDERMDRHLFGRSVRRLAELDDFYTGQNGGLVRLNGLLRTSSP